MLSRSFCRLWPALAIAIALVHPAVAAAAAAKWLPAKTDIVLTVNVRQFLQDHKDTDAVQQPLERVRQLKAISDLLGLNPLQDIQRVTFALRRDAADSWIVVVEGRFHTERLRKAVQQIAQQTARSVKTSRLGKTELWQVPDDANGLCIALLNDKTLVIAGHKEPIAEVAARAGGAKNDRLTPGRRALLERAEKQHVALYLDRVDTLLADGKTAWMAEMARVLGDDNALAKVALAQVQAWTSRYGKDILATSVGISIHATESRLHLGLLARKPAIAKELATRLDGVRVLAALAAKTNDNGRSRQLGDILLRTRLSAVQNAVGIDMPVPHAFVQAVAEDARTALRPLSEPVARRIMSIPLWRPLPPAPGDLDVDEVRDIAYRDGPDADPIRHRLDLFLPRGKKSYPVVVLVHGGGWVMGDNRCCGLYSSVGHFLASQGIGVVLPNYRLSPAVTHPAHARDVARAVRWTRDHSAEHGGDPDRIYLMGHSAGGHLVALLATDESYLKAEGLRADNLKGIIAVSGVYRIPPGTVEAAVGGTGPRVFRPDQLLPLRDVAGPVPMLPPLGIRVQSDVFGPPFGQDAKVRAAAAPISHVRRGLPPFLILCAEHDLPTLAAMAADFHKALVREGCTARLLQLKQRNHNTGMFSMIRRDDPAAQAVLKFIK